MPDEDVPRSTDMTAEIAALRREIERLNNNRFVQIQNSPWRLMGNRFLSGVFTGLGTVIGATLLVSVLVYWLQGINWVPVIGHWAAQIAASIQEDPLRAGSKSPPPTADQPATPQPAQP